METVRQVIDDEVVPPRASSPGSPADLETICLKCLNKEPSRRYLSAAALADDLERYRNGETILARRTPVLERAIKWARRRPAAAALLVPGPDHLPQSATRLDGPPGVAKPSRHRAPERGGRLIDAARDARSQEELSSAQVALSNFLGELERRDGLADRGPARADRGLAEPRRTVNFVIWRQRELEQRTELEKQKSDLAEKQRFRTFVGLRTQAQLSAAEFELGTGDRSAASRTAREALAVYAADPKAADAGLGARPAAAGGPDRRREASRGRRLLRPAAGPVAGRRTVPGIEDPGSGGEAASRHRPRRSTSAAPTAWPGPAMSRARSASSSWRGSLHRSPRWITS